jgi:hypothetical protein
LGFDIFRAALMALSKSIVSWRATVALKSKIGEVKLFSSGYSTIQVSVGFVILRAALMALSKAIVSWRATAALK